MSRTCAAGHTFVGEEPCPQCMPAYRTFHTEATVWIYAGDAAWHFVSLPKALAETLHARFGHAARGWGSLPVLVTIGQTSWRTSVFRDAKRGSYLLPLKAAVREKEGIQAGDTVAIRLDVELHR